MYLEMDEQMVPLQAGFTVSARNFKKAVDRNRIKRLMRECYRLQKNQLKSTLGKNNKMLAIFFIYRGNEMPVYTDIFDKIGGALSRLEKISESIPNKNI